MNGVSVIRMEGVALGALHDAGSAIAENIEWNVRAGEFWVIGGLQGSGKTDFLMMTGGLMAPTRGRYWLYGEPMPIFEESRLPLRLRLGMVFDGGRLFQHLTVRENVAVPLRYHRDLTAAAAGPAVLELLEAMDLGPWADSTPGALGRNWQKRVGLARALMLQPEVLLVDNPLGGLDPQHTNWWLAFLSRLSNGHPLLARRPVTIVVTAPDLRPWRERASRFAVLRDKRLLVLGTWEQVAATKLGPVLDLLGETEIM